MRKKFTMLFAALLAFVGVAKAGVTDLPTLTEDTSNPTWYTIKNTRSGKFITYNGDDKKMTQQSAAVAASFFYFTAGEGEAADGFTAIKIHNFATTNLMADFEKWDATGATWYLHVDATNGDAPKGFHFTNATNLTGWNAWNDYNQSEIGDYYSNDAGGVFEISAVTDFSVVIDVDAAKATAKATLEDLALIPVFTAAATEAIAAVEAVEAKGTGLAELNAAVEEINAIVAASKKASLEGKFFTLYTAGRSQYAKMTATGTAAAATATSPDFIWQIVENNGAYNIYNPYIGKYLGVLGGVGGPSIAVTANQAEAGVYNIGVVTEDVTDGEGNATGEKKASLTFNVGGAYIHLNGSLLPWYAGGASYWTIAEVTDFAGMVSAHKNSSIATLDSWKSLSVVFDAAIVDAAKTAINGINSTDWATFAAIDAELTKVTDAVAAKMFVFQTKATDAGRNGVWISADPVANKAIGADNQDYNAIWSLRHVTGSLFYIYNELNKVYIGGINDAGTPLTTEPMAAYSFEIVDAAANLVELKNDGKTLHASNHADNKLLNWDNNEDASRWMVNIIDVAKDIQDLLDTIEESDYADVPALGQYPTAAYEALVEARTSAKTVEEVEAAIAAFKATLNIPVFFITSKHGGYAAGSAIYYDGAWKWKKANIYDRQMWMTISGYTKADIPAVDAYDADGTSYAICDYLTGTKMRGKDVQIVKVAGWEGAYNLQYNANAESTDAAQHAKDNGQLVNWKPGTTDDAQASVWGVEYIGGTYHLDKLTDGHISALADMQAAYSAKVRYADVVIGDGIGQYQGNKDALVAALEAAEAISGKSLVELATMSVDDIVAAKDAINNAEALVINQPKAGFYRIKSMNSSLMPGNNGKSLLVSDGALALDVTEDAASIMYIDAANGILNYGSGLYINTYKAPAEVGAQAVGWNFVENAQVAGTYALKYNDNTGGQMGFYLSDWTGNVTYGHNDANAAWIFEEVTELPVAVSAAGYATLYAPVALTIAEDVTAYTATIAEDGKTLNLNKVEGTIPAKTGVILEAAANTYNFAVAADVDAIADNALVGSFAKSAKNAEAKVYTLQMPNKEDKESVGFYLFKGYTNEADQEGTKTYINGFRAWIEVAAGEEAPAMFSFGRGQGTTSIENALINTENAVIYDLAGRRVAKMEKGIYIVNGRKVVVK